jgi:hypothetical protein
MSPEEAKRELYPKSKVVEINKELDYINNLRMSIDFTSSRTYPQKKAIDEWTDEVKDLARYNYAAQRGEVDLSKMIMDLRNKYEPKVTKGKVKDVEFDNTIKDLTNYSEQ